MKPTYYLMLNACGAGVCIGAGFLAVMAGAVTATASTALAVGLIASLAGVVGVFAADSEAWK